MLQLYNEFKIKNSGAIKIKTLNCYKEIKLVL